MFKSLRNLKRQALLTAALAASALLAACGSGGGGGGVADTGTLRLALTDRPACGYDAVTVTVQKVRVHQSSTAAEGDSGWSEVVLSPAKRIDLLSLQNGVLEELGQTPLLAGKYTQMRLVLVANDATAPLENSVVPTGGTETALTTPSALQSGLKMNVNIDVTAGQVADFVLDFDACRSVVRRGNSGEYNLKPVVTVIPRVSLAVIGYVATAIATSTTSVSAQDSNGAPVKSTTPDANGRFILAPLVAGNYNIVIAADGRATATITGVPAGTELNTDTARIDPPASAMHSASGKVTITPPVTPIDALVVARKAYTGGPTVEVAGVQADGDSGNFSLSLPAAAPVKAPFATPLVFTADGASPTGNYTLAATSGGATKTSAVNLTAGDVTGIAFAFP